MNTKYNNLIIHHNNGDTWVNLWYELGFNPFDPADWATMSMINLSEMRNKYGTENKRGEECDSIY